MKSVKKWHDYKAF